MKDTIRDAAEQAAVATTPVPVGVSGMVLLGIPLQDWVFIGTLILLVFQLIVIFPKVTSTLKSTFRRGDKNASQ